MFILTTSFYSTLSELNELRKPTSDNPDILRFFRYMRSAKDGQDGIDCKSRFTSLLPAYKFLRNTYIHHSVTLSGEISNKDCSTFNDMSGPAMINTFNDINKLVHARKL